MLLRVHNSPCISTRLQRVQRHRWSSRRVQEEFAGNQSHSRSHQALQQQQVSASTVLLVKNYLLGKMIMFAGRWCLKGKSEGAHWSESGTVRRGLDCQRFTGHTQAAQVHYKYISLSFLHARTHAHTHTLFTFTHTIHTLQVTFTQTTQVNIIVMLFTTAGLCELLHFAKKAIQHSPQKD